MSLQHLREECGRAHAFAVSILQKKDAHTAENRAAFDQAMSDVERLREAIQREEAAQRGERIPYGQRKSPWADPKEYRRAEIFERALRCRASDEDRQWLRENRDALEGSLLAQIGSYSGLGFFVPAGFVYDIENAMKYFAPLIDGSVVGLLTTSTGQPLPYPISNDVATEAQVLGEGVTTPPLDITAGNIKFGAYKYTSGLIKASIELLQDSAFDLSAWLAERFAIRFGRGYERDFTNGSGVGAPTGILTAVAASGAVPVIAVGSSESSGGTETGVNSVGNTDLVKLIHSVDPAYRRQGRFMFHDQTLSSLKRILDKFGRPLWVPGLTSEAPDSLLGYPYTINQHMPTMSGAQTTVLFGDLKKYLIRKVMGIAVVVLQERYAELGEVGYLAFSRADANLVDAGTHPINALQQHS